MRATSLNVDVLSTPSADILHIRSFTRNCPAPAGNASSAAVTAHTTLSRTATSSSSRVTPEHPREPPPTPDPSLAAAAAASSA
jgi:hypothetical protein